MTRIAIMQPYFFPYIGYWQLIHAADRFVVYDDVNYIVRGWINRNRILINGEPSYITVPLQHASQNRRIRDISLQISNTWRVKLIRSIETAYKRAPYFREVFPALESIIQYKTVNLSEYLVNQLLVLSNLMEIKTHFVMTSGCYGDDNLIGLDRIIDICKREHATGYINPQGGQDMYKQDDFQCNDIDLEFVIPSNIKYGSSSVARVPNLSIIDVLMHAGLTGTKKFLDHCVIKRG